MPPDDPNPSTTSREAAEAHGGAVADRSGKDSVRRRRLQAGKFLLGVVLVGVVFQLTVRDGVPFPWYLVYYGLPRPMLAGLAGLAAGLCYRDSKRLGRAAACMSVCLMCWVLAADYGWRAVSFERRPNEFRVAVWNAAGRPSGWTPKTGLPINWLPTTAEIGSWEADLIGLVECGDGANTRAAAWEDRFPGFAVEHHGTGLILLVRGRVQDRGEISCGAGSRAAWYDVEIDGQELRFVLVDIASSLRTPRDEAVAALSAAVTGWSDRPLLLGGDFNLPPESRCLDRLRQAGFVEAFEAAGRGYAPTWPAPIPLLALDQLWGNSRINYRNCRRGWTRRSDHRPVFVEASIARPAAEGEEAAEFSSSRRE